MSDSTPTLERVARALCEQQIRRARRWDTDAEKLEAMLSDAIDYSWRDCVDDARAALDASGNDELRPEVASFARIMERELAANDHKPGWRGDSFSDLVKRVEQEAGELRRAVSELERQIVWADEPSYGSRGGNGWSRKHPVTGERQVGVGYEPMPDGAERQEQIDKIISEAADVANFAMMIADVAAIARTQEQSDG